jgi:flagellar basal body rod protein FlgG
MPSAHSTIQSLKTVDQWIDVINANINGGVRTGFKSSRLKFTGSNVDIARPATPSNSPLQYAETGLAAGNTLIDWTQGAVTASTEHTHLAIQGEGFFLLNTEPPGADRLTRDGEFRTDAQGYLQHTSGLYLNDPTSNERVWDDTNGGTPPNVFDVRLSAFIANGGASLLYLDNKQDLQYTMHGSTVWELPPAFATTYVGLTTDATILQNSLEASNASMTQSVPELSLAQKLFSALTKVLQISSSNQDALLSLIR